MNDKDAIISGPIVRTVLKLAYPVVIGMFMAFAFSVADFFWVGKLGAAAQDAITTSMVVHWTIYALISIISIGITALVSRYVGARDFDRVRFYISQGTYMAIFLGIFVTIGGSLAVTSILKIMAPGQATLDLAIPYLRIFFLSTVFFMLTETVYATFRASGDTRTPMKVEILALSLNIILDPLFIFGIGPFPKLGVPGASLATLISIMVAAIVICYKMYRGGLGYAIESPFKIKPESSAMYKIAGIGTPMASQQLIFIIVYWILIRIVHDFGQTAGAAMGIGNRMESFSYLTSYGFSVAASTMVGQNLGAGKPQRAARSAWTALGTAVAITSVIAVIYITLNREIATIFTQDEEVLKIASDYLFILGLSQFTMAVEIVLEGAFSGSGDTIPPMAVSVPGALARIPLAYYLCYNLDLGINGVWWTLTITTTVKALILALWFRAGRWKKKQV